MGKLFQFVKRGRSAKPKRTGPETAEIVLFTGVRYQREGSPLPDKPVGAAPGAKRRRG